nr:phosphoribosylglycinamide formyltransferase [Brevibacterium sp. ZH18]
MASGSGTLTQAVIDAFADSDRGVEIAAIGADSQTAGVLDRAAERSIPTFVVRPKDCADREDWNVRLRDTVAEFSPDWVISAGFMRILGPTFIASFADRIINTHPALLPSFPGAHGVRDALAHGVRITGGTIHLVDAGVDTGPIITQFPVSVSDDDTEETVHERIKTREREELVRLLAHLAHHDLVIDGRHVSGYATSAAAT